MEREHCVLIHGFTGDPSELAPLADALSLAGYQVTSPQLAGHDGTFSGLRGVSAAEWIASVERPVVEAAVRGPVHLIGFSMGALIAAIVAARKASRRTSREASQPAIASLTLLAPAIHYARPVLLARQASVFVKGHLRRTSAEAHYLKQRPSGFLITPPGALRQFRGIVGMAKRALPDVQAPVCILQGLQDEIVHPHSSVYVRDRIGSQHRQLFYLPASRHHLCLDVESDRVTQHVLDFLASDPVRDRT